MSGCQEFIFSCCIGRVQQKGLYCGTPFWHTVDMEIVCKATEPAAACREYHSKRCKMQKLLDTDSFRKVALWYLHLFFMRSRDRATRHKEDAIKIAKLIEPTAQQGRWHDGISRGGGQRAMGALSPTDNEISPTTYGRPILTTCHLLTYTLTPALYIVCPVLCSPCAFSTRVTDSSFFFCRYGYAASDN